MADHDPLIGQPVSSYRITKLLGAGGMGRVYLAEQPAIGARVAIKVLSLEHGSDPSLIERFFAEARAVNVIRHEGIVNILDLARLPDGRPYIVMEYLDGSTLSGVLAQRGPLPLGSMTQLAGEVLDALAAAHARGIVHRDLKPDNIWISLAGRAKVLDFGIAKLDPGLSGRQAATRAGSIMGTPPYMSPEQAMARAVDLRSDLYSLGIILYEAATGRVPFTAEALFEVLRMHLEEPPMPPRASRPDMPPAMEEVILRALAKDPSDRFPDAASMAAALTASTQGLPPAQWVSLRLTQGVAVPGVASGGVITPYGPSYHAPKKSRAGLYAALLGTLALGGGAAAFFLTRKSTPDLDQQSKIAASIFASPTPTPSPSPEPSPSPSPEPSPSPSPEPSPPPAPEPSPPPAPPRLDPRALLPDAERRARQVLEDAELTRMSLDNARFDGTATAAKYTFRSATASQRSDPSDTTPLRCMVTVSISQDNGVSVDAHTDSACDERIIGWPRCSPAEIWSKASAPSTASGPMQWLTDLDGKTQWMLTIGDDLKWIEDDCTGN